MRKQISIYFKGAAVGIIAMLAAWLVSLEIIAAYLSITYKIHFGPMQLDLAPLSSPQTWLVGVPAFLGAFAWEFRRSRKA